MADSSSENILFPGAERGHHIRFDVTNVRMPYVQRFITLLYVLEPFLFTLCPERKDNHPDCLPLKTHAAFATRPDVTPLTDSQAGGDESCIPGSMDATEKACLALLYKAGHMAQLEAYLQGQFPRDERLCVSLSERRGRWVLKVRHLQETSDAELVRHWTHLIERVDWLARRPAHKARELAEQVHGALTHDEDGGASRCIGLVADWTEQSYWRTRLGLPIVPADRRPSAMIFDDR